MPPRSAAPPPAWAVSPATAAAAAGVDPVAGLSAGEAAARRAQVGPNELAQDPPTPMWRLVLAQFDDMLVKVCTR
jgi:magnesium-transporting ATPase (P-type)